MQTLLSCYVSTSTNLIELHTHQPALTTSISAKPQASPLARRQALLGQRVTNLRHESIVLGDVERFILPQLDATRTEKDLLNLLDECRRNGTFTAEQMSETANDEAAAKTSLKEALQRQLTGFARHALLVG